jgi:hypothetical protein
MHNQFPSQTEVHVSSENRAIIEEWKKLSQHYKDSVAFYPDAIESEDRSSDCPRWYEPNGSDVFVSLEVQKANRALEVGGCRTYSDVCTVANRLAYAIVARNYGTGAVARALQLMQIV